MFKFMFKFVFVEYHTYQRLWFVSHIQELNVVRDTLLYRRSANTYGDRAKECLNFDERVDFVYVSMWLMLSPPHRKNFESNLLDIRAHTHIWQQNEAHRSDTTLCIYIKHHIGIHAHNHQSWHDIGMWESLQLQRAFLLSSVLFWWQKIRHTNDRETGTNGHQRQGFGWIFVTEHQVNMYVCYLYLATDAAKDKESVQK